ncbi:MAG: TIGR02646 family protein [Bacteroidetes bacterium]|jgi:uncharacterized protein (TIGR02646 family)|nr:TIGR02646 family protein [Bacteroidota bacterium]MBT6684945.1 TIGR02646 family protein [Bacteroidota bacterium]MBT7145250.1 TIGR02646 family protein [Bacteroidota bacterium]MBT7493021.1 TIGR02646 family protein [Bacteroidota bacterium]
MRHIVKDSELLSLSNWKRQNPNSNWNTFSGTEIYQELRKTLIDEQNQMCCYCEIAVTNNGNSCHVEHIKDRHNFPIETFNYGNLLASCQHTDSCGHKKETNYFINFISPLQENCQNRFIYARNGRIMPFDENENDAQDTINVLDLNCKRLVDRRKGIIKTLENTDNEYISLSLENCIEWFNGFYTVIEYMNN